MKINFILYIIFIVGLILAGPDDSNGQSYPKYVLPGTSFKVIAEGDTMWILQNHQLKKALKKSDSLKVLQEENTVLEKKIDDLQKIIAIKDQEVADLDSSYTRYKDMWTESDKKLEKAEVKIVKLKKQRGLFLGGGAVIGVVLMILIL